MHLLSHAACDHAPHGKSDGFVLVDHEYRVEAHLHDGLDVHEVNLLAFRTALRAISGWESKPVIIHMGAITGVSLTVRNRLSNYTHPTPVAVIGSTLMDEVIAAFFLRSPTRTKYFTSHEDALHWLTDTHPSPS
ncbi:hypothetical protein AC792_08660 [Arthrobacter sp. RIT-PI-e]|nr:hypothetical protein AC792_08660 [Arthrobacter sp. RIT-PI-e]